MITSRPKATGANWPGIAIEGHTFERAGSGEQRSQNSSPERSSPVSPASHASVSPSGNLAMEAKIASSKSMASLNSDAPMNVPLLVSAIGPRPSQSQLLPRGSQGSSGRAHRAPVPSSHVLRSAGSLCTDAASRWQREQTNMQRNVWSLQGWSLQVQVLWM